MKEKRLGNLTYNQSLFKELLHIPDCVEVTRVFMRDNVNGDISIIIEQKEDCSDVALPLVPEGHVIPNVCCTLKMVIG